MNYREYMRECVKDPQSGADGYGEWGILTAYQRHMIRRLLDEMDSADYVIEQLYKENEELKNKLKNIPTILEYDMGKGHGIHIPRID